MARVLGAILATILSAAACPPAYGQERIKVTAAALLDLGQRFEKSGKTRQAMQIYRTLEGDAESDIRSEARFRLAKMLSADGKTREAAVLMRRIADERPDAAPVRLELADLLHQMGDEAGALRELRALSTLDLPINMARLVDRMSASLMASRPLSFQIEFAVAPDTNINRATRSDTIGTVYGDFAFDKDSKARSGVGISARSLVQGRLKILDDVSLASHASIDADLFRKHEFNDISVDVATGPEFRLGPARLAVEAAAGQQWYGMKPYQRGLRLSGSGWLKVDSVSQIRLNADVRAANNLVNNRQDGRGMGAAIRYERALSPRLNVSLRTSVDRFKATDAAYSTRSWSVGVSASRYVGRTTIEAGADYARLKADDRLQILPAARADRLTRLHLSAVFRQLTLEGFSPTVRIVQERNLSSVEYFDYKRSRMEFGISRSF